MLRRSATRSAARSAPAQGDGAKPPPGDRTRAGTAPPVAPAGTGPRRIGATRRVAISRSWAIEPLPIAHTDTKSWAIAHPRSRRLPSLFRTGNRSSHRRRHRRSHQAAMQELYVQLRAFVNAKDLGEVYVSPLPVRLRADKVREPPPTNVCFRRVRRTRLERGPRFLDPQAGARQLRQPPPASAPR